MDVKYFTLNFGPQHPAAHGVLRLVLYMQGENIKYADPHIGLLHRGTEKLLEYKTYIQGIPYFARLDYVSTISQEHVFNLLIEKLLNLRVDEKVSSFRVIFLELTRLLNHMLAITTHALDVGAMTPFLWSFEEREKIIEFYERVSGARLHTTFFRPGGINVVIDYSLVNDINLFIKNFKTRINEIYDILLNNRIWRARLSGIGKISKIDAINYSLSGPMLRASGVNWDIRKIINYEIYDLLKFNIILGNKGDSFDRFIIRIEEMRESVSIIDQSIIKILNDNSVNKKSDLKIKMNSKENIKKSMEGVINHFKYYTEGFTIDNEDFYIAAETPKGEFGVHMETNNSNKPYRVKIRSTGFLHLQALNHIVYNHLMADLVTIIGTMDLVFGEVDR